MKEIIQFSDDIFYLNELIKTISTACELNLNKALFHKKIVEDIHFAHSALDQLAKLIEGNLTNRSSASSIRSLLKSRASFKTVLEKVLSSTTFMLTLEENEKLSLEEYIKQTIFSENEKINKMIGLLNSIDKLEDPSIFISEEEMDLLLRSDEAK